MRKGAFDKLIEVYGEQVIKEFLSQFTEYSPDDPDDESEISVNNHQKDLPKPPHDIQTKENKGSIKHSAADSKSNWEKTPILRNGRAKGINRGGKHRSLSNRLSSTVSIPERIEEERTPELKRTLTKDTFDRKKDRDACFSDQFQMYNSRSENNILASRKPVTVVQAEVHQSQSPDKPPSMEELNPQSSNQFVNTTEISADKYPSNPTLLQKSERSAFSEVTPRGDVGTLPTRGLKSTSVKDDEEAEKPVLMRSNKGRLQRYKTVDDQLDSAPNKTKPPSLSRISTRSSQSIPSSTFSLPTGRAQFASMIELACDSFLQDESDDQESTTMLTVDQHRASSFFLSPRTGQLEPLAQNDVYLDDFYFQPELSPKESSRSIATDNYYYSGVVVCDLGCTSYSYICLLNNDVNRDSRSHIEQVIQITANMTRRRASLLLDNHQRFHTFGSRADEFHHDLHPLEAKKWFYFPDIFKQVFSHQGIHTTIEASNGHPFYLSMILCHILNHLKHEILDYLTRERDRAIVEDLLWLVALPGITRETWIEEIVKQAAEMADISKIDANHKRLHIFMKPYAQSLWCRHMRVPEDCRIYSPALAHTQPYKRKNLGHLSLLHKNVSGKSSNLHSFLFNFPSFARMTISGDNNHFLYIASGGEFLSFVVYKVSHEADSMQEIYCSRELGCSSEDVTRNFVATLDKIFGSSLLHTYRDKHPIGWMDLIKAFNSRKKVVTSAVKQYALHHNILLPFSFISFYERQSGVSIENALRQYQDKEIFWTQQGMIRITATRMRDFFEPILNRIRVSLRQVLHSNSDVCSVTLCGGFAESPMVQKAILDELNGKTELIVPDCPSLSTARGLLLHGLSLLSPPCEGSLRPDSVSSHSHPVIPKIQSFPSRACSLYTFGVAIIKRFRENIDPSHKTVVFNDVLYCTALFDRLILANQKLAKSSDIDVRKNKAGSTVSGVAVRHYRPAHPEDDSLIMTLYRTFSQNPEWVIEEGVEPCARLVFDLRRLPRLKNGCKTFDVVLETTFIFTEKKLAINCFDIYSKVDVRVLVEWRSGCFYR